jgi:hypothetical protein
MMQNCRCSIGALKQQAHMTVERNESDDVFVSIKSKPSLTALSDVSLRKITRLERRKTPVDESKKKYLLSKCHQSLDALNVLALRFIVQNMRSLTIMRQFCSRISNAYNEQNTIERRQRWRNEYFGVEDLGATSAFVNANHRDAHWPRRIANRQQNVRIVRLHILLSSSATTRSCFLFFVKYIVCYHFAQIFRNFKDSIKNL